MGLGSQTSILCYRCIFIVCSALRFALFLNIIRVLYAVYANNLKEENVWREKFVLLITKQIEPYLIGYNQLSSLRMLFHSDIC